MLNTCNINTIKIISIVKLKKKLKVKNLEENKFVVVVRSSHTQVAFY